MTVRPFVCPFCPLHCDDLDIKGLAQHCAMFASRFSVARQDVANEPSDESLLATAVRWVAEAVTISVTGIIVDLETSRAVCDFVEKSGATLRVGAGPSDGFAEAIARDGMFSITLGDAASPHQHVVMIGDASKRLPRLGGRLSRAGSIYAWQSTENLVERLARLRLTLKRPDACTLADDQDLLHTLDICQKQSAVVFVISASELIGGQQRSFWSTLQGLLSDLNRRIRASVLRFDDSMTLRSVTAWTSDGPHRSAAAIDVPVDLEILFAPWHPAAETLASQAAPLPRRRITIGHPDPQASPIGLAGNDSPESIHLSAAIPGITTDGIVIRGDGSVTLPLNRVFDTHLPTASATLSRLLGLP
jgi:hypothetical protein